MPDNVTADAGSGGAVFATDDVSSVHYPITKITIGAMDSAGTVLTGGAGVVDAGCLRVAIATDAATVTANLGATDNAVLDAIAASVAGTLTVDGSGVTQPVSGTVTANLSATDNAVLDTINTAVVATQAAVEGTLTVGSHAVTNVGTFAVQAAQAGTWNVTNVSGTVSLPTGAATEATLATIDTDTGNIAAGFAAEGSALGSGVLLQGDDGTDRTNVLVDTDGHLQVDILSGGGSNASVFVDDAAFTLTSSSLTVGGGIRDDTLSALAAVEGDAVPLRVNSTGALHVTGAGGGTQYNIDDAGGATDTGTLALAIRDDALTTLTPVDGDYVGLRVSSTGALHVTGGGGGTEYTEDVSTPATIVGTATMVERDDALTTVTPIEGDWIGLRGTAEGALWVQDFNSDGILADTTTIAGDTTSIDGKITACNTGAVVISSGTVTANLGATDNAVLDSIVTNTTGLAGTVSGSELQVDIVAALPAGTNAIGKLAANSGVDIGDVDVLTLPGVAGDVAHDTADSGNPIKIGAKATNTVEGQTQVAANDRVDLLADLNGCLVTRPHTTLEEIITEQVSNTNGTSTAFSNFAAGGAGVHNYITTISVYNSSATNGYIDFRDGTGGAIVFTAPLPTVGGSVINLPVPLKFAANTAVAYDVSGALSTVYISVVGFQAQG